MAVLTEITNSDKDLLLDGKCTIKTKVIISDNKISGAVQEMKYDEENNYYYLNGNCYQETERSKNLFDKNATPTTNNIASKTISDTSVRVTMTATGQYGYIATRIGGSELLGKTLTFGGIVTPSSDNIGSMAIYCGSASSVSTYFVTRLSETGSRTVTLPSTFPSGTNTVYVLLYATTSKTANIGDYVDYDDFMVVEGNSLGIYEPYYVTPSPDYPSPISTINGQLQVVIPYSTGNKLLSIDLGDNELCSLPNGVTDELILDGDTLKITKRIGKIVLNGTENWAKDTINDVIRYFSPRISNAANSQSRSVGLSKYFYFSNTGHQVGLGFIVEQRFYAYPNQNITTIDEFKTWLSTHNTIVYYELTTPTEISLSNYSIQDTIILTEEDSVKDWTIDDTRYVPDVGFMGQFVAKELNGNLQNITDDFNIENKYVNIQMGISTFQGSTTDWYSRGTFLINKPTDDEVRDNTKFDGYDLTVLFNIPFDSSYTSDNFPKSFDALLLEEGKVTNGWLAQYTCEQATIPLATTTFINSDFEILSNQFTSGESCRDIMRYISELAFGYCELDCDDRCYIRNLQKDYSWFDKYHKLNYDQYYSLETQKNSYGPVNRVFCGLQDVEGQGAESEDDTSTSTEETTINIYNNPLVMGTTLEISNQLQLQAIKPCDIIWKIEYRPITKMETIGHPWLKAYEPIEVSDMELNKIITYPFSNTLKYTGHIKSDISSEGETKTEDTYGYKDSIERKMNRIGINVDRANKEITIINQEITKIGDDIKDIRGNMLTIGDVYTKSEIRDIVSGVGVDGTVVTSLETATTIFDINGMTIGRTDAQTKTNVNANGMIITDATNDTELLKINNNGVYSENLTARTYLNFATHGRFEKYKELNQYRIGCFWIEGDDE